MTVDACGSDSGLGAVIDSDDHGGDESWIALILVSQVRCLPERASFHPRRSTTLAKRFVFHPLENGVLICFHAISLTSSKQDITFANPRSWPCGRTAENTQQLSRRWSRMGRSQCRLEFFHLHCPILFVEIKWTSSHFPLFQFYDGFVKSVRPINVRRLLASDSEFVRHCKEEQMQLVGL